MKIKITKELKDEILLTLKNGYFEVLESSKLCKILNIKVDYFDVMKFDKIIEIDKRCKIELLQCIKQGYINTDNSVFVEAITPPTFLEVMIAASQVDED